ncbi:hypothetical protein PISMIDRAFT_689219 [Pisolithus microcarpus 441]|uniref:Uncharacterized protein n=1 Tax=Pisolithus microcarpus 441 TaxID=765257 RepID=A0A0C9YFN8_9AGAM|nr:hypothetical protein PISMIDRAFT_689219 [Pisolithus microcarpus 441]
MHARTSDVATNQYTTSFCFHDEQKLGFERLPVDPSTRATKKAMPSALVRTHCTEVNA